MAGSVNKVILVGNLGKDPEVRTSQQGSKIVNFTLATSESWNDKSSGERREKTEWHRVVVFNDRLADVAERFLRKGKKVFVEGSLQTRKWTDQSGQEKYTTEVVIDRFRGDIQMIDSARGGGDDFAGGGDGEGGFGDAGGGGGGGGGYGAPARSPAPAARRAPANAPSGRGGTTGGGGSTWDAPPGGDLDDEIPF